MTDGGAWGDGWDFFASYSQENRPWAQWCAWTLKDVRYRAFVPVWNFPLGSHWATVIDDGVGCAARTVAVPAADREDVKRAFGATGNPTDVGADLRRWAGGTYLSNPAHDVAVLGILAYFFEECDIFLSPDEGLAPRFCRQRGSAPTVHC